MNMSFKCFIYYLKKSIAFDEIMLQNYKTNSKDKLILKKVRNYAKIWEWVKNNS